MSTQCLIKTVVALVAVTTLLVLVAACGATPTPTPTPAPTPTPTAAAGAVIPRAIRFSTDILPIFRKNCTRCHSGANPPAGLDLDSHAGVKKGSASGTVIATDWKTTGSPGRSVLYEYTMKGVMPKGGDKLSDADLQTIAWWIGLGAPDN